jgi:hypothetical protein
MRGDFPTPPVVGSELLLPITSWHEMHRETEVTKVEFDLFWYDSVNDGVAYFFRWLGEPRATVLVVWNGNGPTQIECRKIGDLLASDAESAPILAEVSQMFRSAGFGRDRPAH